MRLITHNMLKSNIKGIEEGYPLKIVSESTEIIESEYNKGILVYLFTLISILPHYLCLFFKNSLNKELVLKMLTKIHWRALLSAASDLDIHGDFESVNDIQSRSVESMPEPILKEIHHLLFEVHVQEGKLKCPVSGRVFPIKDGIPNMLLLEDEV